MPFKIWSRKVALNVSNGQSIDIEYEDECGITNTNFLTFTIMYNTRVQHLTPTASGLLDIQLLSDKIIIYVKSDLAVNKEVTIFFLSNL